MRRYLLLSTLLVSCDLPTGSLPSSIRAYGSVTPAPNASVAIRMLVTGKDGAPVTAPEPVSLVLDSQARALGMHLAASSLATPADSIEVTSDGIGLVQAQVRFGDLSGRGVIHLYAPGLGTRDSLAFDLPLGNATSLFMLPVIPGYVGDTLGLGWTTYDASGQIVFSHPAVTVGDTTIAAPITGTLLRAKQTGSTWVRATQGSLTDSAYAAVVPHGRIGAVATGSVWTEVGLAGVDRHEVFGTSTAFSGARYSPSHDTLAFMDSSRVRLRLPGPSVVRLVPAALGFVNDGQPAWSADGQWIYFSAVIAAGQCEIWRIHPNGTAAARAGPAAAAGQCDQEPSVNAAGTLLAFSTNRTLAGSQPTLRVIDLTSGATVFSGPAGVAPRFDPSGSVVAFRSGAQLGQLMLINADGTNTKALTSLSQFSGQITWSPDGRWIAVAQGQPGAYLHLVDTSNNSAIRLPYSALWGTPDWH